MDQNLRFDQSFSARLERSHTLIRATMPEIVRVAAAIYDPDVDMVKAYAHSSVPGRVLEHHQARLVALPSLKAAAGDHGPRIINDFADRADAAKWHNKMLLEAGIRSSLTLPVHQQNSLFGFLFFNASEPGFFTEAVYTELQLYAELLGTALINEVLPGRMLEAALNTARTFTRYHDEESQGHLARMSRYARLIAIEVADEKNLTDAFIESVFRFAPLHDIGKMSVPDRILLKPGKLEPGERWEMQKHVAYGLDIVEQLVDNFNLTGAPGLETLMNIIGGHHEHWDGRGYPEKTAGEDIPIEARIVAVADVFDALTSKRPYKDAWSNQSAITYLREKKGSQFEPELVDGLIARMNDVIDIQLRFSDPA